MRRPLLQKLCSLECWGVTIFGVFLTPVFYVLITQNL